MGFEERLNGLETGRDAGNDAKEDSVSSRGRAALCGEGRDEFGMSVLANGLGAEDGAQGAARRNEGRY